MLFKAIYKVTTSYLRSSFEYILTFLGGFKSQMNVGNNMFMEAKVKDVKTIMVLIGQGIYLDFTLEDALKFVNFRIRILEKEVDVIREESIKKRADIKLGLMCLAEKNYNF